MNGRFRFTLDDFHVLDDEPIGWNDAKIVIKRNEDFGGLFLEYATELEFWGDGYAYIRPQIEALGYCFSVKINIEYQCTDGAEFERVFIGYINISRAEIDDDKCTVRANLELDNVYSDFLNNAEKKVVISTGSTSFPNGTVINTPFQTINYHNVETGTNVLNEPTDNRVLAVSAYNLLNYIVQINTEGQLSVVSDFFQITEPKFEDHEITLSGPALKSGDTISVTYKNMFGKVVTKSNTFFGNEFATFANLGFDLCEISNLDPPLVGPASLCNYFFHTGFSFTNVVGRTMFLQSWLPIEILSVDITGTAPLTTATFERTVPYQPGGKDLFISTQFFETFNSKIWNFQQTANMRLSFRDLWNELDALFGLGMQLQGEPGNYVLRIEPLGYFYQQPSQLSIPDILGVRTTFDFGNNYKTVELSSRGDKFGVINYKNGGQLFPVTMSAGSTTMNFTNSTFTPSVGDKLMSNETLEAFTVADVSGFPTSIETTQAATFAITGTTVIVGTYQEVSAQTALLNGDMSARAATCIGDTLQLKNNFVTDIEKHGDQTRKTYNSGFLNVSASGSQEVFTFIQCNGLNSQVYPTIIKDFPGGIANPPQIRYAFNGLLTNHHKIMNNYLRIKYDVQVVAPWFVANGGTFFEYTNTAEVKPSRVHAFEYGLSFNDIVNLIENPSQTILAEITEGVFTKCWIKEIEFDINTKKASIELYESL